MGNAEAMAMLIAHNGWRRGDDSEMQDVRLVGQAIDKAIEALALVELKK